MKESPRPAPLAAALRVKDMAVDLATEVTGTYRKSTRYFKLRLAVIGGWAFLSLLTMWLACPSTGPSNRLGAEVQVSEELLGTQLLVWNNSGEMWTDVTLTLDGTWQWKAATIREGQRMVVGTNRFSSDGVAAPASLKPRSLVIKCAQGTATLPLAGRAP